MSSKPPTFDHAFAEAVDALVYVNPFSRQRVALEQRALGERYQDTRDAWALGPGHTNANLVPLKKLAERFLHNAAPLVATLSDAERGLYAGVLRCFTYYEFLKDFQALSEQARGPRFAQRRVEAFTRFDAAVRKLVANDALVGELFGTLEHLFACEFQIARAFEHIFGTIVGASAPAQALRARVWESVFTCNMRRYERGMYRDMHQLTTLILGPSGTGKELVARAIGMSRYLPFDRETQRFREEVTGSFFALNVAALPANLLESELFGHKRGSFTGAMQDRVGWLESCPEHGTVFLDEIGELDLSVQVKLLRTLESREFQRVGEVEVRRFQGKLIAATNRELAEELTRGTMREDFYYRLCSDVIETPRLAAQLETDSEDLRLLVAHVARRYFDEPEADAIADEAFRFISEKLGLDYAWPGNVRELSQCVLNVAVTGEYRPLSTQGDNAPSRRVRASGGVQGSVTAREELASEFLDGALDADRLLDIYCTLLYEKTQSFSEAARRLGLDRRTVKSRVDRALLERLSVNPIS